MQRIVSILILLILFSAITASQDIENTEVNPKEVTSAVVEIEISGKIHIIDGIEKIIYTQTFPVEDANQKILSVSSTPEHTITKDEQGNREIVLIWNSPESNVLEYKIDIQLERKSFPIIPEAINNTGKYVKSGNNITGWNDEIKNKAFEITNNSGNDLIRSAKISQWVNENVEYDLKFSSTEENAIWIFENRKGVCDEFSHLLISMTKSINIPARDVAGFVHDGKEWSAHAWSEVYVDGKWIPFDSTYNEMGFVDSTHVIYVRDADNAQIGDVIEWEGRRMGGLEGKQDYDVPIGEEIKKTSEGIYNEKTEVVKLLQTNKIKLLEAKLAFYDGEVGERTLVNATLELKNLINTPLIGTFEIISPEEINYSGNEKLFYIEPYSKINLTLIFEVMEMADKKFKYFLPVIVKTFPYASAASELSVNPNLIGEIDIILSGMKIIREAGAVGKEVNVNVSIMNKNSIEREFTLDVCMNSKRINKCERKIVNVSGNSDKASEFLFDVPDGNYTLYIKANASGSFDEFTKNISTSNIVPDEFVEVPYIGDLRLEGFLIISFLLVMIGGVRILLRRLNKI